MSLLVMAPDWAERLRERLELVATPANRDAYLAWHPATLSSHGVMPTRNFDGPHPLGSRVLTRASAS